MKEDILARAINRVVIHYLMDNYNIEWLNDDVEKELYKIILSVITQICYVRIVGSTHSF